MDLFGIPENSKCPYLISCLDCVNDPGSPGNQTVFADVGRFCKKETLFSSFKLELRSRIDLIRSIGSFMKLISTTACDLKKVLHTSTYLGFFNSRLFSATSLDHVLLHQDGHIHETTYLQEPDSVFTHDRIPIVSENKVRFTCTQLSKQ